jgi:thiol:disulfide interchange protein DsbD
MSGLQIIGMSMLAFLANASAVAEGAVRDGRVEAVLIAEHVALVPGREATVGLRLTMDPGWHTYWRNPGDSGMATEIDWRLPEGYTAGEIRWPAPEYHEFFGLASFGYEGEIVLPVAVTVPADADPGETVTLRARADWLVCKDVCEPGGAELELTLPVAEPSAAPAESGWASLFAEARNRFPQRDTSTRITAEAVDGRYELSVAAESLGPNVEAARFFPFDPLVIEMAAEQRGIIDTKRPMTLQLTPAPSAAEPPERLTGVLVIQRVDQRRALHIDVPLR